MAGASINDIKARIKSVGSTMQITRAMELVATSKLRRAKEKAENTRPFLKQLKVCLDGIVSSDAIDGSVYTAKREGKTLYVVVGGDRGLAGGYNSNVFKLTEALAKNEEHEVLPIGKKANDYYAHRNADVLSSKHLYVSEISVGNALEIADLVCAEFLEGKYDSIVLVYTKFVSMISQLPVYEQLLPLDRTTDKKENKADPIYAGEPEEILDKIVPQYVGGVIYSAVCEALAAESAARRTAMNAANKNASEIIDTLVLKYNRARQAVITQEITEIVSGSEAL